MLIVEAIVKLRSVKFSVPRAEKVMVPSEKELRAKEIMRLNQRLKTVESDEDEVPVKKPKEASLTCELLIFVHFCLTTFVRLRSP